MIQTPEGGRDGSITLEQARGILDAAAAKADEIGVPMNIAVVNAGNNLTAFHRQDGADGRLIVFGGGIPLKDGDEIIGAIGVSGGTVDQDEEVAEAGVAGYA